MNKIIISLKIAIFHDFTSSEKCFILHWSDEAAFNI